MMVARGALINCSIFRKEGLLPLDQVGGGDGDGDGSGDGGGGGDGDGGT